LKVATNNIVSRLGCKSLEFRVVALLREFDASSLELPENWVNSGEDFEPDDDLRDALSTLAADQDPDWDDNLRDITYIDATFGWKWQSNASVCWDEGQRLMGWIRSKKNQPLILASLISNTSE
jgi:hypothetical protein